MPPPGTVALRTIRVGERSRLPWNGSHNHFYEVTETISSLWRMAGSGARIFSGTADRATAGDSLFASVLENPGQDQRGLPPGVHPLLHRRILPAGKADRRRLSTVEGRGLRSGPG